MTEDELKKFTLDCSIRLSALRIQSGITQKQMAERCGTSITYISNLENGVNKIPAYMLVEYSRVLGISPNSILQYDSRAVEVEKQLTEKIQCISDYDKEVLLAIADALYQRSLNIR